MNLTVDKSLLTRKLVEYGDIVSPSKERNSVTSETATKPHPLSPPATTRPPTEKGVDSDRKRLRSPDIRNDDDGIKSRKKPKLKRIDNDGKPVRRDDDGVTSTSNAGPAKKEGHRLKRDKASKKEPEVDMDFFSGPSKSTSAPKRKDAALTTVPAPRDGGVANVSRKPANGSSATALGKPRNGTDSNKQPAAAIPKPASRPPAGDGLFIKKRKVS
jgi:hypothetical protein